SPAEWTMPCVRPKPNSRPTSRRACTTPSAQVSGAACRFCARASTIRLDTIPARRQRRSTRQRSKGILRVNLHTEIHFEDDICAHLAAHGWLHAADDAARYDRARALFPADVVAWIQATQPDAWETLAKNHGAVAETVLLDRLRKQLEERGTLDVLRHGVEMIGLRRPLDLAQFKPALAMNPDLQARYEANRLRVVRQVRYSLHNESCIDLVLFLNGIPVATVELKT